MVGSAAGSPSAIVVVKPKNKGKGKCGRGGYSGTTNKIKESEKELDEELKETRSTSLQGKLLQHKLKPKVDVVHALKELGVNMVSEPGAVGKTVDEKNMVTSCKGKSGFGWEPG